LRRVDRYVAITATDSATVVAATIDHATNGSTSTPPLPERMPASPWKPTMGVEFVHG
jgi:hypothetical protein